MRDKGFEPVHHRQQNPILLLAGIRPPDHPPIIIAHPSAPSATDQAIPIHRAHTLPMESLTRPDSAPIR